MKQIMALAGLIFLAFPPMGRAESPVNYQGAAAILRQLPAKAAAEAKTGDAADEQAILHRQIDSFRLSSGAMPAREAAHAWLTIFDRFEKLPPDSEYQSGRNAKPLAFQDVISALPPPAAWDALSREIDARSAGVGKNAVYGHALRLLGHTLIADRTAQRGDLAALKRGMGKSARSGGWTAEQLVNELAGALISSSNDPNSAVKDLETRLELQKESGTPMGIEIPDLVTLAGAQRAAAILRQALTTPGALLQIPVGDETKALARKLALQLISSMKTPQWGLVQSVDSVALYEAMNRKFPRKAGSGFEGNGYGENDAMADFRTHDEADMYYLLGLIAVGRSKDAAALAIRLGEGDGVSYTLEEALSSLQQAGYAKPLYDFFHTLLSNHPDLPYWDQYLSLATQLGETDSMLSLARAAAARPNLTHKEQTAIRIHLYKALLAADRVDEAVAVMRELLATKMIRTSGEVEDNLTVALSLAEIGRLTHNDSWLNDGIRIAKGELASDQSGAEQSAGLVHLLEESGRGVEAESILSDSLIREVRSAANESTQDDYMRAVRLHAARFGGNMSEYMVHGSGPSQALIELAGFYNRLGRNDDVLTLLDKASQWDAADLVEIYPLIDSQDTPLGYMAAAALASAGRKDQADAILHALLDAKDDFDPAFDLLTQIEGVGCLPYLDTLFSRDQFEERPLIWKAHVLLAAGRLDEAEKAARQAITIDPSDGEQKHGRRMRVYTELADILEARGDPSQAKNLREAVTAIRIAEHADEFREAGLLQQGIKVYQEALDHFSGAYCIQSRLAVQLSGLGRYDEAEIHYVRAYELMPDSFGRMESHCFGCEGVFKGKRAESAAEKVFRRLLEKTPQKPQVHYLLGYLREEEDRYQEAIALYKEAVTLDPDYIKAWEHLQGMTEHVHVPPAESDAAALNLLRLDPQGRHVGHNLTRITDLKALWFAVAASQSKQAPPAPETLYPLTASKEALAAKKDEAPDYGYGEYDYFSGLAPRSPAEAIAGQKVISAIGQILDEGKAAGAFS